MTCSLGQTVPVLSAFSLRLFTYVKDYCVKAMLFSCQFRLLGMHRSLLCLLNRSLFFFPFTLRSDSPITCSILEKHGALLYFQTFWFLYISITAYLSIRLYTFLAVSGQENMLFTTFHTALDYFLDYYWNMSFVLSCLLEFCQNIICQQQIFHQMKYLVCIHASVFVYFLANMLSGARIFTGV